jgi:hypothetical protein
MQRANADPNSNNSQRRDSLVCSELGAAGFSEKKIAQQEMRMGKFKRFSRASLFALAFVLIPTPADRERVHCSAWQ